MRASARGFANHQDRIGNTQLEEMERFAGEVIPLDDGRVANAA